MIEKKREEISRETAFNQDEEQKGINYSLNKFRKEREEFAKSFLDMWRKPKVEGVVPLKYKELAALAIVLVQHCKPCIFLHTKICLDIGCTREEILEMAEVAISMGGGIVYEYTGYLLEALDFYKKEEKV
uniref:Carboxymuconolactone decarboxylase family protein n=1 Tax=candidate division WOR-3 bacterium TaxID=2052148 RepID=A0A7C4U934_UNCW3